MREHKEKKIVGRGSGTRIKIVNKILAVCGEELALRFLAVIVEEENTPSEKFATLR